MSKDEPKTCQKPDRDEPGLVCGYPLPCPRHTVVIDMTEDRVRISGGAGLPASVQQKLQEIRDAMGSNEKIIDWSGVPDDDLDEAHRGLGRNFRDLNEDARWNLNEIVAEKKRRTIVGPIAEERDRLLAGKKAADKRIAELEHSVERCGQDYKNVMRDWNGAREILLPFLEDESQDAEIAAIASAARDRIERQQKQIESQIDSLAHFGETLEAVKGAEEFGDLVLRLLKDRDRLQEALVFYATPEHWSDLVPDEEIEQNGSHTPITMDAGWKARDAIGPQAIGMNQPEHPGLDIVKDKPPELVVAARILARALDRTVYLTKMRSPGVLDTSERPWTITIEKDGYGSEVAIEPDGSALECDVWT